MTPEYFAALARYNRWINAKVYSAAAALTDEERKRDRGAFFKSIHATLNHILLADRVWMGRFEGVKLEAGHMGPGGIRSLDEVLYADYAELTAAREQMDAELADWVGKLSAERLADTFRYGPNQSVLWTALAHVFNHQTHHRGQVTTLLTQAGQDVGKTDMIAMFREEAAVA